MKSGILSLLVLALSLCVSPPTRAQESQSLPAQPLAVAPPTKPVVSRKVEGAHRFFDRENLWLFAGVGAARALDYASTQNVRARGRKEILLTNGVVDNRPLFGGIEAAATLASVGVSYLFHRTGHHRLERWTSIVHFTVGTIGAVRNYSLESAHRVSASP